MTLRARSRRETRDALLALGQNVEFPSPGEADWQAVVDTLPKRLRAQTEAELIERLFQDLLAAAGGFVFGMEVEGDLLGGPKRREQLKGVCKDTERLLGRLNALPPAVWLALDEQPIDPSDPNEPPSEGVDMEGLGELLTRLQSVVSGHLEEGIGKPLPGPKLPEYRRAYMRSVIDCWERHTGEQVGYTFTDTEFGVEYTSPFLDFADAASRLCGTRAGFSRRDFVEQIKAIRMGAPKAPK